MHCFVVKVLIANNSALSHNFSSSRGNAAENQNFRFLSRIVEALGDL